MTFHDHFIPGALGTIAALHGEYYARHWNFGVFFEAKVAHGLAQFALRRAENDLVLIAADDQGLTASLILDLNDPQSGPRGAHLRWFIIADRARGEGLGRRFMAQAMAHVHAHAQCMAWLTTFQGLSAARHLYESHGFALTHEAEGEAWGTRVQEQEFQRGNTSDPVSNRP